MKTTALLLGAAMIVACGTTLPAQTPVPVFELTYRTVDSPAPVPIPTGSSVLFPAAKIGTTSAASVLLTNRNDSTWTMQDATVSGGAFKVTIPGPVSLPPGGTVSIAVTFAPTVKGISDGVLLIKMQPLTMSTPFGVNVLLRGTGLQPDLSWSYIILPGGNQTALGDKDTIQFPDTPVQDSTSATIVILNKGNGFGTVKGASVSGGAFKLSGLPLLPADIDPTKDLRFNVVFNPTAAGTSPGTLSVQWENVSVSASLTGMGTASRLTYQLTVDGKSAVVAPGGAFVAPDTAVGNTKNFTLTIQNVGNATGLVSGATLSGTGFRIVDSPPLPANIGAGKSLDITFGFTPTDSGPFTAKLRVDGAAFDLSGTGLGAKFGFAAITADLVSALPVGGTVLFPNTPVGGSSAITLRISNVGNADGNISSIGLQGTMFAAKAPSLPIRLSAGTSVDLPVSFAPTAVGSTTGTLQIDAQAFGLRGTGEAPPVLPGVTFSGAADTAAALDQPSLGFRLNVPYPLDIVGKLNLSFTSDSFVDDPAIQFAVGGRSVDFVIPANTTDALFGGQKQVQFQVGTVAGTIALQPTFSTAGVDLTPATPPARRVTIAATQPTLRSVQVANRTASGFDLVITGFSTPRSLSAINLQFTAAPTQTLTNPNVNVSVDVPFAAWYQSTASQTFGSQFTAVVTLAVSTSVSALQSVAVSASNSKGTSNSVSFDFR